MSCVERLRMLATTSWASSLMALASPPVAALTLAAFSLPCLTSIVPCSRILLRFSSMCFSARPLMPSRTEFNWSNRKAKGSLAPVGFHSASLFWISAMEVASWSM
eukprot:Mycagemm_TRINITY_DN10287_c1_g5::TRINITY_DN10287_c1_g5_i2::g.3729::m.3729 type:complete len:105 gc:universal TRINITY_DN10287_c1_g5_i2:1639-1953(+)